LEITSGGIAIAGILLAACCSSASARFVTAVANSAPGRFLSALVVRRLGLRLALRQDSSSSRYLRISHVAAQSDPLDQTIGE
jgi:NADH-quinone oxidoreductase subunit L